MSKIRRWLFREVTLVLAVFGLTACGSQVVVRQDPIEEVIKTKSVVVIPTEVQEKPVYTEYTFVAPVETPRQEDLTLIKSVASRFKKSEAFVSKVVATATKYASPDFPKVKDILAVIAVESTYNTDAHHRGSWGLMQIEARSHKQKYRGQNITDVDTNIRIGASILREYYSLTKNKRGAFLAYNAGIGNYLKGRSNPEYYRKISTELTKLN